MNILITEDQLRKITEMSMSTFHGSPHDFDKFSTSRVGTGESTQWFGWGLYFTDDESISDWYASSVAKSKNESHQDKEVKVLLNGKEIINQKPQNLEKYVLWAFIKQFPHQFTIEVPTDLLGACSNSFRNFISYKQYEMNGKTPEFPWFDKEKFLSDFDKEVEKTRNQYNWSPKAFKDKATGYWRAPEKNPDPNLSWEYVSKYLSSTLNYNWTVYSKNGNEGELVDLGKLSDKYVGTVKQILLGILESIQPDDVQVKKNDPLFSKTIKYHITLHKGKTPDEYDYIDWYEPMTPEQQQKVLSKLKEEGYGSQKFVMVIPEDEDNIEAVKPRFFEDVFQAKQYILKQQYSTALKGEGYLGKLKIVKTGFNIKKDINDTVQNFYTKLCGLVGSDKQASLFLLSAGIDGIKYPNNTVSGGKTTGYNYVVFDENSVHIDKKEDRPLNEQYGDAPEGVSDEKWAFVQDQLNKTFDKQKDKTRKIYNALKRGVVTIRGWKITYTLPDDYEIRPLRVEIAGYPHMVATREDGEPFTTGALSISNGDLPYAVILDVVEKIRQRFLQFRITFDNYHRLSTTHFHSKV